MNEFKDFKNCKEFESFGLPYLIGSVERFFGGAVRYNSAPISALKRHHEIDITINPRRGVYLSEDMSSAIILGKVMNNRLVEAVFSLHVTNTSFIGLEKLLNDFQGALAVTLTRSALAKFAHKPHQFGDELLELAISKYFSKGYYDHRNFQQLIDLFHSLANTRFEGRNFTTGLVLTRSFFAFKQQGNHTREGTAFPLVEERKLSARDPIEKRFWYLADGQTSYFLADPQLMVRNVFLANSGRQGLSSFIDDYTLSKTIKGGDALFRVTSQSEFSVTGASGIDCNYKEGRWRARNLNHIASVIRTTLGVADSFVQAFLYFALYLSRRRMSSILWVPIDLNNIDGMLLSKNRLTRDSFSIINERHTQSLLRLLSSDGASIFSRDGELVSFGSVIDISKVAISGVKGTGESVASILGSNGVCIKVSQDGTIKLYASSSVRPMII